jgi:cobaltochelatase CobT
MTLIEQLWNWFPLSGFIFLIGLSYLLNWWRRRPVKDPPAETPYKVYTMDFDIEIRAEDIAGQISKISTHHSKYWRAENDQEWGATVENAERKVKDLLKAGLIANLPNNLSDFAICLLVDHSGSMKGETMLAVASTAKAATETLMGKGAKVELLGYTTAGWHGGFSRMQWLNLGRPRYPGRLCAVMHIIYKTADEGKLDDAAFRAMLNPGILYENIDGEAIEWAERRLLARPEKHRLLIVISDGAPVDDSTLMQNGPSILWHHIKQVIARIEAEKTINLGAIGVNYRVDGFYRNAASAEDVSELPAITGAFLEKMVLENGR